MNINEKCAAHAPHVLFNKSPKDIFHFEAFDLCYLLTNLCCVSAQCILEPISETSANPYLNQKMAQAPATPNTLLPLELVDKAIGSRIHIIMKNDKEVV